MYHFFTNEYIMTNMNEILNKYSNILKYFCYCDDKLCNELSMNCNYICNNCIKNNRSVKNIDDTKIKYISDILHEYVKNFTSNINTKNDKIKIIFDIYKILYYNPIYNIIHIKFLITNTLKLNELLTNNNEAFKEFILNNPEYKYIYEYMLDFNSFYIKYTSDNNIVLHSEMDYQILINFLNNYVLFLNDYYKNIIDNNNNNNKTNEIDINNLHTCSFVINL